MAGKAGTSELAADSANGHIAADASDAAADLQLAIL